MATLLDFFLLATAITAASSPPNTTVVTSSCPMTRYTCGDTVEIRYPFWVGTNVSGCGYEYFRLDCRGGTPVLTLPSGEYGVTNIHYGALNRTITVFDLLVSQNTSCPLVAGRNLTLPVGSPPPLSLTDKNTNLTFYSDCSFGGLPADTVSCLESADGRRHTYVSIYDDYVMRPLYPSLCLGTIGIPVLRSSISNSTSSLDAIMPALTKGFELQWRLAVAGECGDCERAGGFCGVQAGKVNKFKCFTESAYKSRGGRNFTPRAISAFVVMPSIVASALIAIILIELGMCGAQPRRNREVL